MQWCLLHHALAADKWLKLQREAEALHMLVMQALKTGQASSFIAHLSCHTHPTCARVCSDIIESLQNGKLRMLLLCDML